MTTLLAYGSLCSGLGLQNLGRVAAQHAERLHLANCRRGFGKLSSYGDRYAMVLEPLHSDEPIRVDCSPAPAGNVQVLAVTVGDEDLGRIARREGYDPTALGRLQVLAHRQALPLGEYLWRILESVGFEPAEYRRSLFGRTGYTSPHYIPHPVARDGDEPALVFLPPGPEGSGDESVVPVRVVTGMTDVLSVRRAWQEKPNPSQIEYFAMCVLAEVHGLSLADVLVDLEADSELSELLRARLRPEVALEPARFRAALDLAAEQYDGLRNGFRSDSWLIEHSLEENGNAAAGRLCLPTQGAQMPSSESFRVYVTKDYLKFSAAHFIAYKGFREALHGHNYRVSVAAQGKLGPQGYVVDFGVVKRIARRLCDSLDETMLIPMESDCLTVKEEDGVVVVRYEQDEFRFPRGDVTFLPIVHTSVEELARYLTEELKRELAVEGVTGITAVEVGVEESFGQAAYYRQES